MAFEASVPYLITGVGDGWGHAGSRAAPGHGHSEEASGHWANVLASVGQLPSQCLVIA